MIDKVGIQCSGCQACAARCPKKCISFVDEKLGFQYPEINYDACINCNLCEKVCQALSKQENEAICKSFAVQYKDKDCNSSSGGVFSYLAKHIISTNGVVYGAAFNRKKGVEHVRIDSFNDIQLLCGSKYVKSIISESIFNSIKEDLKRGRKVLFVGTPCQVSGLQLFLKEKYDNLIPVDLICHGVPSRRLFSGYLKYCEKLRHKEIVGFSFRDNRDGWNNVFKSTIIFSDGTEEYNTALSNLWNRIFFSENATRPNCNDCQFANMNRVGDITLGDFWGLKDGKMFNQSDGISLVLCNNDRAISFIEESGMTLVPATTCEEEHPNLFHPTKPNTKRDEFMKFYLKNGFSKAMKRYFDFDRWLDFKIRTYNFITRLRK